MEIVVSLHPQQLAVFNDPCRFKIVAAGRRWGKSRLACWTMLIKGLSDQHTDKDIFYIAPTYQQAKDIMWGMLKSLGKEVITTIHENTGVVTLVNGRRIHLKGSDRPETLRGVGLWYVVMDEYAFMKPEVWEQIIMPTLTDVKGEALFIGTPDGKNHFYDLFSGASNDPEWSVWQFKTMDNPFLPADEVKKMISRASDMIARQEFDASFESFSGSLFKNDWIIYRDPGDPEPEGQIYVAVDLAGFSEAADLGLKYKRLDESAIAVVKVHQNGWIVKEIVHGRWNVRETAVRILRAAQKYRAICIGIEKGALKNAVMPYLDDTMRRLTFYPRIEDLTHGGKNKVDRIMWSLQGRFQHGKIELERSGDWIRKFQTQYNDFPNPLSHDDLMDALSYIDQIAVTDYAQNFILPDERPLDELVGY